MANLMSLGGRRRIGFLCFFVLCIFLLLSPCAKALNKTDPTRNANLAPFIGWWSSYYCLHNFSKSCQEKYVLKEGGWLNVTQEDGDEFCNGGCADHTRAVLDCVHYVKRDYVFINKATVYHINETINHGCNTSQGFNGTSLYPTSGEDKI